MEHGIKPSREQRKFIEKCGYNSTEYLVIKDTSNKMWIRDRNGDTIIKLEKEEREQNKSITKIKTKNYAELLELRSHYIGGSDEAVQDKTIKK